MNDQRRKQLTIAIRKVESAKEELESILAEEQDYLENMPDSFRAGAKGEKAEDTVSELEDAISSLEDVITSIETAAQ